MFGLTEQELEMYRGYSQDFAVQEVTPKILNSAKFMAPVISVEGGIKPDEEHVKLILSDIETIITLVTSHMAYEYAHLQCESKYSEVEILKKLHRKYSDYLVMQFIKYGISFTIDVIEEIIGELILEMPYLYINVVDCDTEFENDFLEERMEAYSQYLDDHFSDETENNYDGESEEGTK